MIIHVNHQTHNIDTLLVSGGFLFRLKNMFDHNTKVVIEHGLGEIVVLDLVVVRLGGTRDKSLLLLERLTPDSSTSDVCRYNEADRWYN